MVRLWRAAAAATILGGSLVQGDPWTSKHEAGRCALRGTCSGTGFFSPSLPCVDNGLAEEPEAEVREKLVDLCGPKWNSGPICCDDSQVCPSFRR